MNESFNIDPIRSLESRELGSKEQLKKLKEELKIPSEKLKTITNREFLNIPKKERLQYVTKWNIDYAKISSEKIETITFFFDQDKNGKDDSDLYKMTTLGQVIWIEVSSVESNWNIYTRTWLDGEFFNWNKRLTIHTDTIVKIGKLRTTEEIENIRNQNKQIAKNYTNFDQDITQEALERNITDKETLATISKILSNSKTKNKQVTIEELFTQYERIRNRFGLALNDPKIKDFFQGRYIDYQTQHPSWYEKYKDLVDSVTSKYPDISAYELKKLIDKENWKWNPNLKALWSSAYGLWQMINGTWLIYWKWLDRSNPKDQLEATCKYLDAIMKRQKRQNYGIEIAMAYYNTWEWILNITEKKLQEYAKNNKNTIAKHIEWPLTKQNYFTAAVAYYNDISFNKAKEFAEKAWIYDTV